MPTRLHPNQAITFINDAVTDLATHQLKLLLETKHLYQKVPFDPTANLERLVRDFAYTANPERVPAYLRELPSLSLELGDEKAIHQPMYRGQEVGDVMSSPGIGFLNVKMFCSSCESREAFTATWMRDIDRDTWNTGNYGTTARRLPKVDEPVQQHFCVAYLCMACSSEMVIVMVRRRGWMLSLEGRSPLEIVSASSFIPKKERSLFVEAMVARNVGKALAAVFFLRTFIEQFARRQTGLLDSMVTGDQMMDEYAKTIPREYREVMPSLKVWYSKLSGAIHSATGDDTLLAEAFIEIEKHFKVRDAFGVPDVTAPSKARTEAAMPVVR